MTVEDENASLVDEIRTSWIFGRHISTLPRWARLQEETIKDVEAALPNIDADTRRTIVRQLLFALRCHTCERKLTDQCTFSICVRGLMSGVSGMR
ncbi:MAG: hypothetical protein KAW09_09310 [Thermoplasmata archaeon]|nr:hypothetical protein [Thermoplasmata archaeon]